MNIKNLIIVLLFSVVFFGCKTKRKTIQVDGFHVQGTALYEKANITGRYTLSNALFGASEETPIPNAVVHVVDTTRNNEVVVIGTTDDEGFFKVGLPDEYQTTALAVRVYTISSVDFITLRVQAHDSGGNRPYFIQSEPFVGTKTNLEILATRDEDTGRLAGPFNIYTQMLKGIFFVRNKVEPNTDFPALTVDWGQNDDGRGCTCFFRGFAFIPNRINITDDASSNTNDFDDTILQHELGHYMHHAFGENDSPGGPHFIGCSQNQDLDLRLSWSEGWANGFAMMVLEQERYVDTQVGGGWFFDLENPCSVQQGPASEVAVGAMYLDLYDGSVSGAPSSDGDPINLSFAQIWNAMKNTKGRNLNVYDYFLVLRNSGAITTEEWNRAFTRYGLDESAMVAADAAGP